MFAFFKYAIAENCHNVEEETMDVLVGKNEESSKTYNKKRVRTAILVTLAAILFTAAACASGPPKNYAENAYPILSGFGSWTIIGGKRRIRSHEGVDIRAPVGTPVYAAASGLVVDSYFDEASGNTVRINIHMNNQENYRLVYEHLDTRNKSDGTELKYSERVRADPGSC